MKLVKSLLLGSAAGFAMVAGAQAADLPVKKAVEYVKVCSVHGAGFFYIPGSDTCIKIGGMVRAEVLARNYDDFEDARDQVGWRTRVNIDVDARTATAYGTVRAFIRAELNSNSGSPYGAPLFDTQGTGFIRRGFVQFAGLTAGRAVSFFDFSEGTNWGTLRFSDGVVVDLLAYTATFGNGMSATIGIEDPANRRNAPLGGYLGGTRIPDVVANFRIDQAWGSVQLSGALHEINVDNENLISDGWILPGQDADSEYGYAIGLGAKLNLNMLAPGDYLWLNATYADGALGYIGFDMNGGLGLAEDAALVQYLATGNAGIETNKGWQVSAGFQHYWTPNFRSSIFGSYAMVDGIDDSLGVSILPEFTEYRIGLQNVWMPTKGLDIGLELLYWNQEATRKNGVGIADTSADFDAYEARIRVQRTF